MVMHPTNWMICGHTVLGAFVSRAFRQASNSYLAIRQRQENVRQLRWSWRLCHYCSALSLGWRLSNRTVCMVLCTPYNRWWFYIVWSWSDICVMCFGKTWQNSGFYVLRTDKKKLCLRNFWITWFYLSRFPITRRWISSLSELCWHNN